MKKTIGLLLIIMSISCSEDNQTKTSSDTQPTGKQYFFGIIEHGSTWTPETTEADLELQKEHIANINRLADENLLALAGPFWMEDRTTVPAGLFIFNIGSQTQADSLSGTDPAVIANRLEVINYPITLAGPITYNEPVEMIAYFACFFNQGPNWTTEINIQLDKLNTTLSESLKAITPNGQVILSGQFSDSPGQIPRHSFFVFTADSLAQITEAVSNTPGVVSGELVPEVMHWYGPAGLKAEPMFEE